MDDKHLLNAREIIADADRDMARCFVRRMKAVREIAAYKQEHNLPILDASQEQVVISRGLACIGQDDLRHWYIPFIQNVIEISRQYQCSLLKDTRTP